MYDAVFVLVEAFNKLLRKKPDTFRSYTQRRGGVTGQIYNTSSPASSVLTSSGSTSSASLSSSAASLSSSSSSTVSSSAYNNNRALDCNTNKGWVTPWEHGDKISRYLRKVEIEGLTGDIRFNDDGRRQNYTLHIAEMTVNSAMVKVAEWSDDAGLVPVAAKYVRLQSNEIERNKTYIVTTIIEEPYIMMRKPEVGETLEGNDRFEGYCKDLADLVTKKLGINCKNNRFTWFSFRK